MGQITRLGMAIAIFGVVFSPCIHAGPYEVGSAKGLMIASILHEKCTGKQPLPNETERQVKMLQAQGFSATDIQRGFMEGMLYAESTYPRNKKPPQSECKSAISLYNQSMKFM